MHGSVSQLVDKRLKLIDHLIDSINGQVVFLGSSKLHPRFIQQWVFKDHTVFNNKVGQLILLGLTLGNVLQEAEHFTEAFEGSTLQSVSSEEFFRLLPIYRAFGDVRPWALLALTRALKEVNHYNASHFSKSYSTSNGTILPKSTKSIFIPRVDPTSNLTYNHEAVIGAESTSTSYGIISPGIGTNAKVPRLHAFGPSLALLPVPTMQDDISSSTTHSHPSTTNHDTSMSLSIPEAFDIFGGEPLLQSVNLHSPVVSPIIPNSNSISSSTSTRSTLSGTSLGEAGDGLSVSSPSTVAKKRNLAVNFSASKGTGESVGQQIFSKELFGHGYLPQELIATTPDTWSLGSVLGETGQNGKVSEIMVPSHILRDELQDSLSRHVGGESAKTINTHDNFGIFAVSKNPTIANSNSSTNNSTSLSLSIPVSTPGGPNSVSATNSSSVASPLPSQYVTQSPSFSANQKTGASSASSSSFLLSTLSSAGEGYKYVQPSPAAFSLESSNSIDIATVMKLLLHTTKTCYQLLDKTKSLHVTLFSSDSPSQDEKMVLQRSKSNSIFNTTPSLMISHAVKQAVTTLDDMLLKQVITEILTILKAMVKAQLKKKLEHFKTAASLQYDISLHFE